MCNFWKKWFLRKLLFLSTDPVNHLTCLPSCKGSDPIWVPLQTRANPLMNSAVPLLCVACWCWGAQTPANGFERILEPTERVSAYLSRCFGAPPSPSPLYLPLLIQATSWSWAGLILFTPREALVCGQTACDGHDPAACSSYKLAFLTVLFFPSF